MKDLEELDFSNYASLLDWLVSYEKIGNWLSEKDLNVNKEKIIKYFGDNGYEIDSEEEGKGSEKEARNIIGQSLFQIKKHGIPLPAIKVLVRNWKARFSK